MAWKGFLLHVMLSNCGAICGTLDTEVGTLKLHKNGAIYDTLDTLHGTKCIHHPHLLWELAPEFGRSMQLFQKMR